MLTAQLDSFSFAYYTKSIKITYMKEQIMRFSYLDATEVDLNFLHGFVRRQSVTHVLRRMNGAWQTVPCVYTDDWRESDRRERALEIHQLLRQGGRAAAAYEENRLLGLAVLNGRFMDSQPSPTLQLAKCHVSEAVRRQGIGTRLFAMICQAAQALGAEQLYISGHSAVETAAFYRAMGCADAAIPDPAAAAEEPCDMQLTRDLRLSLPLHVDFPAHVPAERLAFSVIYAQMNGQTLFCRHRLRDTWEFPGGHIEPGEAAEAAARRELWEETGAEDFTLSPVCVYRVACGAEESYGMLFRAEVRRLGTLPPLEIAEVRCCEAVPGSWTYPQIQPKLLKRLQV